MLTGWINYIVEKQLAELKEQEKSLTAKQKKDRETFARCAGSAVSGTYFSG